MFGNVPIVKDDLTINSTHELIALGVSESVYHFESSNLL